MTHNTNAKVAASLGIFACVLLLMAVPVKADEDPEGYPTNLGMMTEASKAAINEMFLGLSIPKGSSILVESETAHEARWFVRSLILERLLQEGYQAFFKAENSGAGSRPSRQLSEPSAADSSSSLADLLRGAADSTGSGEPEGATEASTTSETTDFVFRYTIAECSLTYPSTQRRSPLGSRSVQRLAVVNVFGNVVATGRNDVVWVGRGDAKRIDTVPESKLDLLEGTTFPFTEPSLAKANLSRYVEPVLVIAIVAGLITLFYSNQ
jgi:hypothetical protein